MNETAKENAPLEWSQLSTEQKKNHLRPYDGGGISSTQIAEKLFVDFEFKVTRNVVIGMFRRNGWKLPPPPPKMTKEQKAAKARKRTYSPRTKPQSVTRIEPPKHDLSSNPIRFLDTTNRTCKWPLNGSEPGPDMMCCGGLTAETGPYCEHHAKKSVGEGTASEAAAIRAARNIRKREFS